MPPGSKHNICSSQKTRRCQKHVQNKKAWRHPSKKEIKEKKDMWKAKQESLYFHLIFSVFCGLFCYFPIKQSWTQKPGFFYFFFFFTVGDTITWTLKAANSQKVILWKGKLQVPGNICVCVCRCVYLCEHHKVDWKLQGDTIHQELHANAHWATWMNLMILCSKIK